MENVCIKFPKGLVTQIRLRSSSQAVATPGPPARAPWSQELGGPSPGGGEKSPSSSDQGRDLKAVVLVWGPGELVT